MRFDLIVCVRFCSTHFTKVIIMNRVYNKYIIHIWMVSNKLMVRFFFLSLFLYSSFCFHLELLLLSLLFNVNSSSCSWEWVCVFFFSLNYNLIGIWHSLPFSTQISGLLYFVSVFFLFIVIIEIRICLLWQFDSCNDNFNYYLNQILCCNIQILFLDIQLYHLLCHLSLRLHQIIYNDWMM